MFQQDQFFCHIITRYLLYFLGAKLLNQAFPLSPMPISISPSPRIIQKRYYRLFQTVIQFSLKFNTIAFLHLKASFVKALILSYHIRQNRLHYCAAYCRLCREHEEFLMLFLQKSASRCCSPFRFLKDAYDFVLPDPQSPELIIMGK